MKGLVGSLVGSLAVMLAVWPLAWVIVHTFLRPALFQMPQER